MASLPVWTYDQMAAYIDSGWQNFNLGSSGIGANKGVIHYNLSGFTSFPNMGSTIADADGLTDNGAMLARKAIAVYESILDVDFVETTSTGDHVDIYFRDIDTSTYAFAFTHPGSNSLDTAVVNVTKAGKNGTEDIGSRAFYEYLHEIGHALGLGHAGSYNYGTPNFVTDMSDPNYNVNSNIYLNDSWQSSIMSYISQGQNTTIDATSTTPITPMIADWIALSNAYGLKSDAFAGNTIWGFNTNVTVPVFKDLAEYADKQAFTLIDHGGWDTVDFSGYDANQKIDLGAEAISDIGGLTGNMVIGRGTVIENAKSGAGDDTLIGNEGVNFLYGGGGNDNLYGGGDRDWLYGQNGNDTLHGGSGDDRLYGGAGNDLLNGQSGNDRLYGGTGNDILFKSSGTGWVDGGTGTDWLSMYYAPRSVTIDMEIGRATADVSTSFGFAGIEKVSGSKYSDVLRGASGNDTLYGWGGADIIEGRGGNDRLYGHGGVDRISGSDGNDSLFGGDGNDILQGDQGNDLIDGGDGLDRAVFTRAGSGVTVDLENTGAQYTGTSTGWDTIRNVENLTGSNHDDFFRGNNLSNVLVGGRGSDRLIGEAGNDILAGGTGNDVLEGRSGADVLRGGTGADKLFGGVGQDEFTFGLADTGNLFNSQADIIHDFEAKDTIHLSNTLTYGGSTSAPGAGKYTVWQHDGDFVISWKHEDEYRDVIVRGVYDDDPTEWVETDVMTLI